MNKQPTSAPVAKPAIRYHGSKFRLASWVLNFFPAHVTYVEPFGGSAGVLLQKDRAYAEIYNDLDEEVVNFFSVLRDPALRDALIQACLLTPYARREFNAAWEPCTEPVERARRLAIRAQMGFGSGGATKAATGFRIDTDRLYGTGQSLWADYPFQLAAVGERLRGVLIENRPAAQLLQDYDASTTLFYVDPPYVPEARDRRGTAAYRHDLDEAGHSELLEALQRVDGMVVLSGYDTPLYAAALPNWERHTTTSRIAAGRGTALRTEVLWLNPACSSSLALPQADLFGNVRLLPQRKSS